MSKTQKEQTVTINDVEHKLSDLNADQITMVNHVADLDRKIESSKFNLQQLQFGRDSFMNALTGTLPAVEEPTTPIEVPTQEIIT